MRSHFSLPADKLARNSSSIGGAEVQQILRQYYGEGGKEKVGYKSEGFLETFSPFRMIFGQNG